MRAVVAGAGARRPGRWRADRAVASTLLSPGWPHSRRGAVCALTCAGTTPDGGDRVCAAGPMGRALWCWTALRQSGAWPLARAIWPRVGRSLFAQGASSAKSLQRLLQLRAEPLTREHPSLYARLEVRGALAWPEIAHRCARQGAGRRRAGALAGFVAAATAALGRRALAEDAVLVEWLDDPQRAPERGASLLVFGRAARCVQRFVVVECGAFRLGMHGSDANGREGSPCCLRRAAAFWTQAYGVTARPEQLAAWSTVATALKVCVAGCMRARCACTCVVRVRSGALRGRRSSGRAAVRAD